MCFFQDFSLFLSGFFRVSGFSVTFRVFSITFKVFSVTFRIFSDFEVFLDFLGASGAPTGEK